MDRSKLADYLAKAERKTEEDLFGHRSTMALVAVLESRDEDATLERHRLASYEALLPAVEADAE